MAFLRYADYLSLIRKENLEVVSGGETSLLRETELAVQAEMTSYLSGRYDVTKIFVDLKEYSLSDTYNTGDLIYFPDQEDPIYSANEDGLSGVSPVDDPSKWTKGDTRDQLIRMHMVDMVLYHIHSRINPRNIPDYRIARRDDCINWLKRVAKGDINANLPLIEPVSGQPNRFNWGANDKFGNNNY